jgi:pimeloyl-ACP methyl ester carboxylesterase
MKAPLILLPGALCDAAVWQNQIPVLSAFAKLTLGDLTVAESISEMAANVLASAPPTFALAGYSLGGVVALEIIRRAPERVSRLALLSTSARADTADVKARRWRAIEYARYGNFDAVKQRLLRMLLHPDHLGEPFWSVVNDMGTRVGCAAFIRQATALSERMDSRPSLAAIAVPTLVLGGEADAVTPAWLAEELAANISTARLVTIKGAGHMPTLEKPEAVNRAMTEWLRVDSNAFGKALTHN